MKQATVNLLADMDCQPATLDPEMTAAIDQLTSWTFPTMTSMTIPATATVPKDSTATLRATAVWSNGISTDFADYVTWTSDDEDIATVKEGGVVAGITQGDATITAVYGAITETCTLTVGPRVVPRDTFLPASYNYGGAIFSDGAITLGTQFRKKATGSIFLAGVRFWRSTVAQSQPPVGYAATVGGTVLATKVVGRDDGDDGRLGIPRLRHPARDHVTGQLHRLGLAAQSAGTPTCPATSPTPPASPSSPCSTPPPSPAPANSANPPPAHRIRRSRPSRSTTTSTSSNR